MAKLPDRYSVPVCTSMVPELPLSNATATVDVLVPLDFLKVPLLVTVPDPVPEPIPEFVARSKVPLLLRVAPFCRRKFSPVCVIVP